MNGVMMPGVSAGSNHVGASEMWTAHVSCPSGPAASAVPLLAATMPRADSAITARRVGPEGVACPVVARFARPREEINVLSPIVASHLVVLIGRRSVVPRLRRVSDHADALRALPDPSTSALRRSRLLDITGASLSGIAPALVRAAVLCGR